MNRPAGHFQFLDGLRGVAILAVLFLHTISLADSQPGMLPWSGWFRQMSFPGSWLWYGPMIFAQAGVPIFFAVSGFCIHLSFQQQEQRWGNFFIRRLFRIYPAYLAALIIFTWLYLEHYQLNFSSGEAWTQFLTHLFLVHNLDASTISAINPPFWSLAVEAQLYLLYPALLALVASFGWRRSLILLGGCEMLIRVFESYNYVNGSINTPQGVISEFLSHTPAAFWFSWAFGAYVAEEYLKKRKVQFSGATLAGGMILVTGCFSIKALYPFLFPAIAVSTAAVIARLTDGKGLKSRIFGKPSMVLGKIGLWSYSIYLLHEPLLATYHQIIKHFLPATGGAGPVVMLWLTSTWLAIIFLSALWHEVFELPGIARGKLVAAKLAPGLGTVLKQEQADGRPVTATPSPVRSESRLAVTGILVALLAVNCMLAFKWTPPEPGQNRYLLERAKEACERSNHRDAIKMANLAEAYAVAEKLEEAIVTAQRACELAVENGETNQFLRSQKLLKRYQSQLPKKSKAVSEPSN